MEKSCKQIAEILVNELKKQEYRSEIEKELLDPIVHYLSKKLWPYLIVSSVILCIFLFLIFFILINTITIKKKSIKI